MISNFPNPFSGNQLPEQFSYFMSSNALTNREHLIELYNRGERNFAEVRLSGVNLKRQCLNQINLSHSYLKRANLAEACLINANFNACCP
jgi:uncharacterized protein YjbI with pentapeptide repeats